MTALAEFHDRMGAINDVLNAVSVLQWDQRTMMPPGGAATRGKQVATLVGVARDMLLADETRRLTDAADRATAAEAEDSPARRAIAQTRDAIAFHARIPGSLQTRRAEVKAVANAAWIRARTESDFAIFAPYLQEVVALTRAYADAIGYESHPYDAMLSIYEPGQTVAGLETLFDGLRGGIAPLLAAVRAAPEPRADFLARSFPKDGQADIALALARKIGFDTARGRLDETVHPFEVSFTREDVRIATRFHRDFLNASLFGTLHEAGHGIYEQGVDPAYTRTPLATDLIGWYAVGGVSFGMHESQSRLYENHIGRSRAFWRINFDALRAAFPGNFDDVDAEAFYRAVNLVRPGFIRVEADELTYDMHVMLRVEIESALLDGSLEVAGLPTAWNEAMLRDLGLAVPDDRRGVLQDIHWSNCMVGSFCTYTIGNVVAAQLMDAMRRTRPDIQASLDAGDYAPLRAHLNATIHRHGRRFTRDELLLQATGRRLDPAAYLAYLRAKVADVYGVGGTEAPA
jgi:carboxypeptidase Taq